MKTSSLSVSAVFAAIVLFCSCGGNNANNHSLADRASGDMATYENSAVNGVVQALPTIMFLPSDNTLQNFGAMETENINGRNFVVRDYQKYLNADDRFRRLASTIQNSFNSDNYPLQDFEQTLKQLDNRAATDMTDNLQQDAKTLLLQTANPDIILELDYSVTGGQKGLARGNNNTSEKATSYTLSAIDAYTNKVVATITESNLKGASATETIQTSLNKHLAGIKNDIVKYFSDLQTRGREVTLRITVAAGSNQKLSDENIEGDTYTDYIIDYVKTHTIKGAYKMQTNTDNELYFVNVRIPMIQDDGTQYGVYDWARDLSRAMRKDLGVRVSNKSQGLGEVVLTIEGMN